MNRFVILLATCVLFMNPAHARDSTAYQENSTCYFVAPIYSIQGAVDNPWWHLGASAQKIGSSGFGWTVDVGYLSRNRGIFQDGFATLSAGLVYRLSTTAGMTPFLMAGYGMQGLGDFSHYAQLGGGFDFWGEARWGLRLETRAQLYDAKELSLIKFRIGFLN